MTRAKLEVWMCFNEDGDYVTGTTKDDATEAFTDQIGTTGPLSVVCLNVDVCLPEPREATVTLADDAATEILVTVEE